MAFSVESYPEHCLCCQFLIYRERTSRDFVRTILAYFCTRSNSHTISRFCVYHGVAYRALQHAATLEKFGELPRLFTDHDPARGSGEEVVKFLRVETGLVRGCSKPDGSLWARRVQILRVGSRVTLTRPHPTRPNPTRPDPTRPDQTRPDQTRPATCDQTSAKPFQITRFKKK